MLYLPVLRGSRRIPGMLAVMLVLAQAGFVSTSAQNRRQFSISAYKYGFRVDGSSGGEIHVRQDDLVTITFSADDIPHSFTIDGDPYRINRRAEPGKPVTFEFRADREGRFPIKCTLTVDEKCKEMQGWLVVDAKRN